jgi:hypothetical protein
MRRNLKVLAVVAVAIVVFFFAPFLPTATANFGGGPDFTALVSPSFALFQCGVFVGHPGIEVPNGSGVAPGPIRGWWSSFWNCDFPRL